MAGSDTRSSSSFPRGMGLRLTWVYAAMFVPFAVVVPYLQVLLEQHGFDERAIGTLQGLLGLMAVAAPPLWGFLSDRIGRPRLVLMCAAAAATPAFLVFGCARSLPFAIAAAVLYGFINSPIQPLTDGFTFQYIHRHGGDYGKVRTAGSAAFIVTVIVLERVGVGGSGAGVVILVAAAVAGAHHLLSLLALPGDPGDPRARSHATRVNPAVFLQRGFLLFTLTAFLGRAAMMSYYHFFTLFLKQKVGYAEAGNVWLLGALSEIPVIFFSGRIMRKIGVKNLFALGLAGCAVRLAGFGWATELWQIVPLQLLHALTFGAFFTASVTYVSRLVPAGMKSSAQTVFSAATLGLGTFAGGALAGHVLQAWGYAVMYRAFAGIALFALFVLLVCVPREAEDDSLGRVPQEADQ